MNPINASRSHCPKRKGRNNCCFVCSNATEIVSIADSGMETPEFCNVTGIAGRRQWRERWFRCSGADGDGAELHHPFLERVQSNLALLPMALLAVADARLQGREEVEGNVRGLEAFGVGLGDVVEQRSEGARSGRADG